MLKSNFTDISPTKSSKVPKVSLKKAFIHLNTLVTVYFYSNINKKLFDSPKNISKQTLSFYTVQI